MALQVDPGKAGAWVALLIGLGTVLAAPFKVFATRMWVRKVEKRVEDMEKTYVTKADINGLEQRLQGTLASNNQAHLVELRGAIQRMDAFINTVKLLKDLKENEKNKEDEHAQGV